MIVFAGPSLTSEFRDDHPQIEWRPPAIAGDLLSLVDASIDKVLLIDGLFEERASVKHKEVLALMASGCRVFGASSMGALRAVELAAFGMIPLGRIGAAYMSGLLVGDDEVALVHGQEDFGWQPLSVPMVEVRATLCRAVRERLIDFDQARRLRACWHDIHYVDREWATMAVAAEKEADNATLDRIAALHVPLKRLDAEAAISTALVQDRVSAPGCKPPETIFLSQLRQELNQTSARP